MFEPPELRDAQSFQARAERLFVRALDHALIADLTDWSGLGLGLEAAHNSLMLCPFESEEELGLTSSELSSWLVEDQEPGSN